MAEGLLRTALPRVDIKSAGLQAVVGAKADQCAQDLMQARGVDISQHRSQQFLYESHRRADLILVMDSVQKVLVEKNHAQLRGRVFRLGHFTKTDIFDPYQLSQSHFAECLALIDEGVREWQKKLDQLG